MTALQFCYCLVVLFCVTFKVVRLSPINGIQDSGKVDVICSHDCSIKQGYCENGGTCLKLKKTCRSDSYVCVCPDGFAGVTCSEVIIPCKYDAFLNQNCDCLNGGTCRKIGLECSKASYKCECTSEFEGLRCETNKSLEIPIPQNMTLDIVLSEVAADLNDSLWQNFSAPTNNSLFGNASTTTSSTLSTETTQVIAVSGVQSSLKTTTTSAPITTEPQLLSQSSAATTTTVPKPLVRSKAALARGGYFRRLALSFNKLKKWADKHRPTKSCQNCVNGTCEKRKGGATKCVCNKGYGGKQCDIKCEKSCQNGGVCLVENGLEICTCSSQFVGDFCETYITNVSPTTAYPDTSSEANPQVCYSNFICVNGVCDKSDPESPKCICDEGFIGAFCQHICTKQCYNGGWCALYYSSEKCICVSPFIGEFCNETQLPGDVPHPDGATDSPDIGKSLGDNVCSDQMVCVHGICDKSDPKLLNCRCHDGYLGDLCDKACSRHCLNEGACRATGGIETCECAEGFTGKFCEHAVNVSGQPSHTYPNNGQDANRFCSKNFECIHGVCDKTDPIVGRCLCFDGYTGVFCQTPCSKPCQNGGRCLAINGTELCMCPSAFSGEFCADEIIPELKHIVSFDANRTDRSPSQGEPSKRSVPSSLKVCSKKCLNGGQCIIQSGVETCECVSPFSGPSCETKRPSSAQILDAVYRLYFSRKEPVAVSTDPKKCSGNFICQHGVCDKTNPRLPRCICDTGYIGSLCHLECTLKCQNSGTCVVLADKEQACNCKYGFSGRFCEYAVFFDKPKPSPSTDTTETTTLSDSVTNATEDAG